MKKALVLLIAGLLALITFAETLKSIPAFARKYKMSCQTCHSPIPRLKAYGNEFAGNGFKLADKDSPRFFVETGDDDLSLIRDFPIAVRFDGHVTYNNANEKDGDFGVPYILKLMSGGEITDDIAYYFYFYMSERGEVVGVEDCYVMFNDMFGIDLDLYFGQFQVSDPLFKRELRLTLEDYQAYKYKAGMSKMNLAYDRGFMLTYGMDWGTDIILEVVNGCGLTAADANKLFDIDGHKTIVGRVSQDIGDFLRIGGYILTGKEDMINDNSDKITNNVMSFGPDITLSLGDMFELNLQYVQRKDDNLYLLSADNNASKDMETKGAMTELIFTPNGDESKWYGAGLFNWIESDIQTLNYKTGTLHFGYLLRRNLRIVAEGTYDFSIKDKEYAKFSLGFVSAF
ncbi:hypothetical protein ACFLSQ_07105 [Bacteroidota bacterium]